MGCYDSPKKISARAFVNLLCGDFRMNGKKEGGLFLEVAVVKTLETLAMAGFVTCHLVYGVVDGVKVQFLCTLGNAGLVFASSSFCGHTLLKVGFGVPNHIAEEFGKFGGMLGLFPSVAFEGFGHFRITLAVSLAAHGEVHAHFAAFALAGVVEVFNHFLVAAFGHADYVLGNELQGSVFHFFKLAGGYAAEGALLGSLGPFVYITAHGANEFFVHWFVSFCE